MLDDSERSAAVEAYAGGVINLRAVAWAYHRRSLQTGQPVSAEAIMADCEAAGRKVSRTAAYRALQGIGATDQQSRISGQASTVPHIGTESGPGIPESGTASPGKRDSAVPESRKAGLESAPLINPQDQEIQRHPPTPQGGAAAVPEKYPPSPEASRKPVVDLVADLTAGSLERWASNACRLYPAEWVGALARRKLVGCPRLPTVSLLNSILQRWAAEGPDEWVDGGSPVGPSRSRFAPPAPRPSPTNLLVSHRKDRSA